MKREILCVRCPVGCQVTVEMKEDNVVSVSGNACKNGEEYAISECTHPVRTLTTLVRCESGTIPVPVRTSRPIAREKIEECLILAQNTIAHAGIRQGEILIKNILQTNSDLIATRDDWN